jgi:hypothetical protein
MPVPRLALIGAADQAASVLVGALVIKEAAKPCCHDIRTAR